MSEGGMGETVTVLNPVSYRQISCTVTGAGTVSAGDMSSSITQIASLQK
jgi:flagella basal body P-ring formation protein FlgA